MIHFGAQGELPPLEERLARLLADRFGRVVSRRDLSRAACPSRVQGGNALDVQSSASVIGAPR